jgi:nucleotide-binding universal stress UspA family protein
MPRSRGTAPVTTDGQRSAGVVVELREDRALSVSWAAGWAQAHHTPLVVLVAHPVRRRLPVVRRRLRKLAQQRADLLLPQLRERHPGLAVSVRLVWDEVDTAFLALADRASGVVLQRAPEGERQPAARLVRVAAAAPCPVVVLPADVEAAPQIGPVVVGVDDSPEAWEAVEFAAALARRWDERLCLVHAWEVPALGRRQPDVAQRSGEEVARRRLDPLVARLRRDHPHLPIDVDLVRGDAVPVLLDRAREAALLVVGSRGRGGVTGLLLGSVSRELVLTAPVPVVVARTVGVDEPGPHDASDTIGTTIGTAIESQKRRDRDNTAV